MRYFPIFKCLPLCFASLWAGCSNTRTYSDDVALVRERIPVIELGTGSGPRVAIAPAWQGRVLTSAFGPNEAGLGWLNHEFIRSGATRRGMHPYGGEERLWLGPEGGAFGLFFRPGDPQDLEHWQTPAALDTKPWNLITSDAENALFMHQGEFQNAAGTSFRVLIRRQIHLLSRTQLEASIGPLPPGVEAVAHESRNTIRNTNDFAWTKSTGMPSLWVLSMLPPGKHTTICVPYAQGDEADFGERVRSDYFGALDEHRLRVSDRAIFLRADGEMRSKIGVPVKRAMPILGAWDAERQLLTLAMYNLPEGKFSYVDSRWDTALPPYDGDVVNAYNDGPPAPGAPPLGPFFELETSSPALALEPGHLYTHLHRTIHLRGERAGLDAMARRALGVGLDEIEAAFATSIKP